MLLDAVNTHGNDPSVVTHGCNSLSLLARLGGGRGRERGEGRGGRSLCCHPWLQLTEPAGKVGGGEREGERGGERGTISLLSPMAATH